METKKLSKSLTDNRFGGWGWSMIFYTMILYFFYAAITTDGMNLRQNETIKINDAGIWFLCHSGNN